MRDGFWRRPGRRRADRDDPYEHFYASFYGLDEPQAKPNPVGASAARTTTALKAGLSALVTIVRRRGILVLTFGLIGVGILVVGLMVSATRLGNDSAYRPSLVGTSGSPTEILFPTDSSSASSSDAPSSSTSGAPTTTPGGQPATSQPVYDATTGYYVPPPVYGTTTYPAPQPTTATSTPPPTHTSSSPPPTHTSHPTPTPTHSSTSSTPPPPPPTTTSPSPTPTPTPTPSPSKSCIVPDPVHPGKCLIP